MPTHLDTLAENAAFVRVLSATSSPFTAALARHCPEHHAQPGQPCWTVPTGTPSGTPATGVCPARMTPPAPSRVGL